MEDLVLYVLKWLFIIAGILCVLDLMFGRE